MHVSLAAGVILNSVGAFQFPNGGVHESKSAATHLRRSRRGTGLRVPSVASPSSPQAPAMNTVDGATSILLDDDIVEDRSSDPFDWFKSWYPIVPVEFLDAETPHAYKLMGMDIVVWNDGPIDSGNPVFQPRKSRADGGAKKSEGQWRAFADECPHRKVPLSEGRIEDDGSLLCSYHGWRFDGEGGTIDVPQIGPDELGKIKSNPKSNCSSFPVRVVDGVLWVWPDASDDARIESALTPVPSNDYEGEVIEGDRLWLGPWNFRGKRASRV